MLDLVSLGFRLEPTQDKINGILAIERVPIYDTGAEEDSPEKITPFLVYHDTYTIGTIRKSLTPAKKPEPSPYPCSQGQTGFRGWRKGDAGAKNVEVSLGQSIKKTRVDQMHRFSRH